MPQSAHAWTNRGGHRMVALLGRIAARAGAVEQTIGQHARALPLLRLTMTQARSLRTAAMALVQTRVKGE